MLPEDAIEELARLAPPRPDGGLHIDWAAVEAAWGLSFPGDYKEIVTRYGKLLLEGYLELILPTTVTPDTCDEPGAPRGGMGFVTADTRATWEETEPDVSDVHPDQLVTWGAASSADDFCWVTQGEPDEWPVMVFSHGDDTWTQFPFGVCEFLVRVLKADPDVAFMAETPLWGNECPTYADAAKRSRST
ncbi:SMI1/KNR4 family protein [Streptomyces sp. NPDC055059]|uniref:SMI1/KNR4 family protein n=1 Tax=Streptomyces sp. NPDC127172 TaxID=3345382 RepID=UPI0036316C82